MKPCQACNRVFMKMQIGVCNPSIDIVDIYQSVCTARCQNRGIVACHCVKAKARNPILVGFDGPDRYWS
eukprot:XP_001709023.1 Hypothetical protein GL50803_87683 [Giardia lamblia ATCC 50803]